MKSLDLLDALVAKCALFPYPDILKDALTLRAQFVLDVAPFRDRLVPLPVVELEPE